MVQTRPSSRAERSSKVSSRCTLASFVRLADSFGLDAQDRDLIDAVRRASMGVETMRGAARRSASWASSPAMASNTSLQTPRRV